MTDLDQKLAVVRRGHDIIVACEWVVFGLGCLGSVFCFSLPPQVADAWYLYMAIPAAVLMPIFLPFAYFARHRALHHARIVIEAAQTRWTYPNGEWQRMAHGRWLRTRGAAKRFLGGATLAVVFLSIVVYLEDGSWVAWGNAAALVLTMGALGAAGLIAADRYARHYFRSSNPEIWIGPEGLYANGTIIAIHRGDPRVLRAALIPGHPAELEFDLRYHRNTVTTRFPVPIGRESEAQALVDGYRRSLA